MSEKGGVTYWQEVALEVLKIELMKYEIGMKKKASKSIAEWCGQVADAMVEESIKRMQ